MALKLGELTVDIGADTRGLKNADKEVKRIAGGMTKAFKRVGAALAVAISFEAARRILLVADNMRVLERRLVRFTGTAARAEKTMRALTRTASETGSTIANTVSIFERFSLVREGIGATNADIIQLTDTLSKLGALGGSSGEEISNSLRQMSQSFSLGVVQAQEFNSIVENTPEVVKAIAREMDLTMGQVRARMLEGELTARDVFNAMQDAAAQTNLEFEAMPKSIEMVTQALTNNLSVAIGNVDDGLGFSVAISNAIQSFADLVAEINTASAAQEQLDKLLNPAGSGGRHPSRDAGRGPPTSRPTTPTVPREVAAAREVNELISKRNGLEVILTTHLSGGSAAMAERRAGLREELALIDDRIEALTKESTIAKKVADIRAGVVAADEDPEVAPVVPPTPVSDADTKRLEKLGHLAESELEEINRIAAERRAFVLSQEQLTGDERADLMGKIRAQQIDDTNAHNDRLLAIEVTAGDRRAALAAAQATMVASQQQAALAGLATLANLANTALAQSGKEGNMIVKGIVLAAKAIQVVQILAATEVAAANAAAVAALGGPVSYFATQGAVRAAGYASAALVAGLAVGNAVGGGRQHGGSVSPQLAHPINEAGVPEILTQAGKQFLLPTGQGGTISPLGNGGGAGGGAVTVNINSSGTPQQVTSASMSRGEVTILIQDAVASSERKTNNSLASGRGDTANSLKKGFTMTRNLS